MTPEAPSRAALELAHIWRKNTGRRRRALGRLSDVDIAIDLSANADTETGEACLYRATGFDRQPDRRTKSSSLFAEKRNVTAQNDPTIRIVDFPAFLDGIDHDVALIKIDIEGAEVPLLEALLASPVADRIGDIFVETHERALPHLAARMLALKTACQRRTTPRANWDWH